jgi:hypothetical protein
MFIYYRISDNSYQKAKLIGATKEYCLMNFCLVFHETIFGRSMVSSAPPPDDWIPPMRIIADRCERSTINMLKNTGIPFTATEKGNAGSFLKALDLALEQPDDELIYFCEDDYLHHYAAPKVLQEGIKRADYVTLYDHPDKYTRLYNGGEFSKVIKTPSSHWRFTISTCMTFGATVKTLKEDQDVFRKYCAESHPRDHAIFTELKERGRKLAVCIPGLACHTDLTLSGEMNQVLIDPWAIQMMTDHLQASVKCLLDGHETEEYTALWQKTGWDRLVGLDALKMHLEK